MRRTSLLVLGFALFLFLCQGLVSYRARWVEDESWYSIPAHSLATEGRLRNPTFPDTDLESKADMHPPAMPWTIALMFKLFGVGVSQARLASLTAGLLLIVTVYVLTAMLIDSRTAAGAALVVATDNFVFLAARTVRPEIFVALFCCVSFALFVYSRRTAAVWPVFLSGLAMGLAINYHVIAMPFAVSLLVLYLAESDLRRVFTSRRFWSAVVGIAVPLIPFAYWILTDPIHRAAFEEMYSRGRWLTLSQKVLGELHRYADLFGFGSQRLDVSRYIPYRIHIVAGLVIALAVLWHKSRQIAKMLLIVIVPSLLAWVLLINKTSRYFAVMSPWFAIMLAAAVLSIRWDRSWTRNGRICLAILLVTQLTGNIFLLRRFRNADYSQVSRSLRDAIPDGAVAYGAITFWLALHDHKYYSYNRMPVSFVEEVARPAYIILGDRVLMSGEGYDDDTWTDLRNGLTALVKSKGRLVARIPSDFYGNLEVFSVSYDGQSAHSLHN